ncbi:UNVERIFIED_CONTAM: hypothetical protein FKN15_035475 [Acipenser sinensis]
MKTAAIAIIALLVSASLIDLPLAMADGLVQLNTGVQVGRGQVVYVTNNELQFNIPKEVDSCKVEVVLNEPITQRVGKLGPQVFDCHFLPDEVKYTHNGSPILEEDNVMLRIYRFTESETFVETFLLNVQVKEPEASLIQFGVVHLEVPLFHGVSNPVDGRVVSFNTSPGTICTVRIMSSETHTPAHGQLVTEDPSRSQKKVATSGSILHKGLRKARQARLPCPSNKACHPGVKEVRFLKANCEDFLHMGLKYQHLSPPSPNVDYIPIRVEIRDEKTHTQLQAENAWIPVKIWGAIQNQQPRGAFMSMFILEVDQFILTPLSTASLDAEDDETPQSRLVFSVTKPPDEGYITHLDDHTKPVSSFSWQDLYEMKIAYQPPNGSHRGRRNFEVEFEAIDGFFLKSPSIMVYFSIRTTETNAPRVSWNMGKHLRCRPPLTYPIQVHGSGRLRTQDERPRKVGRMGDSGLELRVSGYVRSMRQAVTLVLAVEKMKRPHRKAIGSEFSDLDLLNILMEHVNEGMDLLEGQSRPITWENFQIVDNDNIHAVYLVTVDGPQHGRLTVRGTPVLSFLQRDLFHGLIYYHHLGGEVFEDSFDFTLSDSHDPPNLSQTHTVVIHISPVKDQLPKEVSDSVRSIVVKETEIAYITKSHLHFRDTESPDTDLMYFVTKPCFSPRSPGVYDAGKLFYTDSMSSMKKDTSVPVLKSFTQHAVNHLKVGYMPPQMDIGPEPFFVQFVFTVTDQQGGELTGLIFNITVTPVDNQQPEIFTNQMKAEEGSGCFITPENLLVRDVDSREEDLRVQLKRRPQHGDIELQGLAMLEGDFFTLQDLQAFKVRYQHDDSETLEDAVVFTATDGFNSADGVLIAQIIPLNDEPPELGAGLKSGLECPEGGKVLITAEYLYATDADSDDAKLTYMLGRTPTHGAVRRSGVTVDRFTQLDVIQGFISYVHTGGEIGPSPCSDTVTLIVSDGEAGTVDSCCQDDTIPPVPLHGSLPVYDLNITVLPINNQPPSITVGDMFVVDEGSSAGLLPDSLSASDDDTFPEGLHFLLETPPQYGYLENTLPSPGYEKSNTGLSVVSFSTQHLQNGYIHYVQSQHQGLEPTADHFMVAVSDGVHKSMARPFYVIINPTNDESPLLHLGNLTVRAPFLPPLRQAESPTRRVGPRVCVWWVGLFLRLSYTDPRHFSLILHVTQLPADAA